MPWIEYPGRVHRAEAPGSRRHTAIGVVSLILAAILACGASEPKTEGSTVTEQKSDLDAIRATLTDLLLAGAAEDERTALAPLVDDLVALWDDEAEDDEYRSGVLAALERNLRASVEGKDAAERQERLRYEVAERSARYLSRLSLELGQTVVDGTISVAEAAKRGQTLLDTCQTRREQARTLRDPGQRDQIDRTLQDVFLESRFAVHGGPTSLRLGRYQQNHAAAAEGGDAAPPRPRIIPH